MLSNRPLLDNRADARYFVDTGPATQALAAIERGHNTLIEGEAGAGKTTLLRILQLRLREAKRAVAFVSLAQAESVHHATVALARAASDQGWVELDEALVERALRLDDPFAPNQLIRALAAAPRDAVFLVDGITGTVGHALFGRLRDELWQLERVWVVAVDAGQAAALLQPPADAFFETHVRLGMLSNDAQQELLRRRNAEIDGLLFHSELTPRRLIELARQSSESGVDPQSLALGSERRLRAAEDVGGRPAAMLVAEMENLGPVSAGDERLLDRLGWTRPRAATLLNQLEKARVVESRREHRDGPGQPRKVYTLRDATEFLVP